MAVRVRSFLDEDLSELVELLNDTRKGSYEFMPVTEEDVRARIREGRLRILMAEENGEVVGSVTYNDGFWGEEIRWLVVDERPDQKLIEDVLVCEVEKLFRGQTVFTSVDDGSPKIGEWMRRGYTVEGGLYQMISKVGKARQLPSVPESVVLRSMKLGEEKQVVDLVNAVFGWERLKPGFVDAGKRDSPPFDEEWVHIAELQGRVLSVVVAWPAVNYNRYFGARRGYLGPAATVPEYRSKKLASALTVRAMNFLYERGMDTAVVHTSERNVASLTLLRNIGFEVGHLVKFLRKNLKHQG